MAPLEQPPQPYMHPTSAFHLPATTQEIKHVVTHQPRFLPEPQLQPQPHPYTGPRVASRHVVYNDSSASPVISQRFMSTMGSAGHYQPFDTCMVALAAPEPPMQ
eukprot:NODE_1305_length_1197_cov_92.348432_g1073_i0.p2 GENE.NODE_1305_length_1197_cov_92.348432_g1073_i0~~NODE_1305_length_1197_cov_92.348432_g1073_i0.p2  ORF type:complete len:104 (+),score=11.52 NODE_1305_length_1197_cov_92.348432_g1073_i0:708-1019(+)